MNRERHEEMAIMTGVTIGCRDINEPCLWFSVTLMDGCGALQVLGWEDARQLIKTSGYYDFKTLEGKPCRVDVEGNLIKFQGLIKV